MQNKITKQDISSQINTDTERVAPQAANDVANILTVALQPKQQVTDYLQARQLADTEAAKQLNEYMLMSWYDRDRNFESPQSAGECHEGCPTPGYVDYGLHHGAALRVDIENGRFVFFYAPVEW